MNTRKWHFLFAIFFVFVVGAPIAVAQSPIKPVLDNSGKKEGDGKKKNDSKQHNSGKKVVKTASNPQRTVLYSLRRNECLSAGECMLAFKSDGYHYSCITTDTLLKKDYLIIDGVKKVGADRIYASYLDPCNYNNSIFSYNDRGAWTLFIEGRKYGPYYADWVDTNGWWVSSDMGWSQKEIYSYYNSSTKKWEKYYSGKPYTSKYHTYTHAWYKDNFKSDTISSINNRYKVFSNEFGTITYNGVKYRILPAQSFNKDWQQSVCVLDDGLCVVEFYQKEHPLRRFIFENGSCRELPQNQFFNFRTKRIENGNDDYGLFTQADFVFDKKQLRMLYDVSGRHTLETCGLYNYVLIDNKEYGSESAIYINYDKERNEFQWIALERKALVLYRFKL